MIYHCLLVVIPYAYFQFLTGNRHFYFHPLFSILQGIGKKVFRNLQDYLFVPKKAFLDTGHFQNDVYFTILSKNIHNDLDFRITYENRDEMGELCKEFERMREQLVKNNRKLWNALEEERILRAAIAHDIRSPLSVLEGYQEMLMEFLPDGTIDKEEAVEMLWESKKQIERMDAFVDTMQKLSSLAILPDAVASSLIGAFNLCL